MSKKIITQKNSSMIWDNFVYLICHDRWPSVMEAADLKLISFCLFSDFGHLIGNV